MDEKKGNTQVIYVDNKGSSKVVIHSIRQVVFDSHRRLFLRLDPSAKVGVNRRFVAQFDAIWAILVPRWHSKEAGLLGIQAAHLLLRTWLSLQVARLDGRIVRDLVAGNGRGFLRGLAVWLLFALPASYTNSTIRFLQAKIAIAFRTRLTRYVHDLYLDRMAFYKAPNLDGAITTAMDQYMTTDVANFCDAVSALYCNMGKPFVDLIVFNYGLAHTLGPVGLTALLANYVVTAWMLKRASPAFGRLAAKEARLEGEFRNAHSRVITNAEEIAFYNGAQLERSLVARSFRRLVAHLNHIYRIRIAYNMFEDFILKYAWSAFGYLITSLPIFFPSASRPQESRMQSFITSKRLMHSLADAGGRMMYSLKDLAEVAGLTSRVYTLLSTLHRVHASAYPPSAPLALGDVSGTLYEGFDGVRLESVPVVRPASTHAESGTQLVAPLDMVIHRGDHLLISGPNGCGKSAVARILAGIWPVFRGLVSVPRGQDISFIPQRAYFSAGTLRDQIIYPQFHADMLAAGRNDGQLLDILTVIGLPHIPSRDGGWEAVKEWKDTWSGGEKQRMNLARLLYHRPKYAVIDEGTAAVSADVEGDLYEAAKQAGITLLTISHRPSLLKYHQLHLRILPHGDWSMERIGTTGEQKEVANEIRALEEQLASAEGWRRRKREIDMELGYR